MVVGHRRFARALVATSGLAVLGLGAPAPAGASPAPVGNPVEQSVRQQARQQDRARAAADAAPLAVRIDTMSPASLPATGPIRITGTVTNRTDETWTDIDLYAFASSVYDDVPVEPMRTQADLEAAMLRPPDDVVGERIVTVGRHGSVEELEPGATAPYTVVVPADAVQVTRAGVYWFGVHALGTSSSSASDDTNADGRARTLLPYVPRRFASTPLPVSLVVPLTAPLRYADDGSVEDPDAWARALGPEGRLSQVLDFVDAADAPVTWLVDPALVDAVAQLADGNPARSLGPTRRDGQSPDDPAATEAPSDGAEPDGGEGDGEGDGGEAAEAEPSESALAAAAWLDRLRQVLPGNQVLTLPYGNVDVPAVVDHAPRLLELATAQRSAVLGEIVDTEPVITSPSGYLDADSVRAASSDTHVLLTDRVVEGRPPTTAVVDGRPVTLASYGATQGSPGPGVGSTPLGLRQRLAAEAAVRAIARDRRPLVAVLPLRGRLSDAEAFFDGLAAPWLDLDELDDVEQSANARVAGDPPALAAEALDPGRLQRRRELDDETVRGVEDLISAGDTLQTLLLDNSEVGGAITEEALTGLSYSVRNDQATGRYVTLRSRTWVEDRLDRVRISAAAGVTLASDTGEFVVTLTNNLDHPVVVGVRAESDAGIEVQTPERVELAPGSRQTVVLEARTSTNAVHTVRLSVTDQSGRPLGSTAELPIRSTAVSGVIWVILGIGGGLLFLAIAVRLVRRVQAARHGVPGAGRRSSRPEHEESRPAVEVG